MGEHRYQKNQRRQVAKLCIVSSRSEEVNVDFYLITSYLMQFS